MKGSFWIEKYMQKHWNTLDLTYILSSTDTSCTHYYTFSSNSNRISLASIDVQHTLGNFGKLQFRCFFLFWTRSITLMATKERKKQFMAQMHLLIVISKFRFLDFGKVPQNLYHIYHNNYDLQIENLQSADNAIKSITKFGIASQNKNKMMSRWQCSGNRTETVKRGVFESGVTFGSTIYDEAQLVGYAKFRNAILKMKSCYGFEPQCGAQQLQQLSLLQFTKKKITCIQTTSFIGIIILLSTQFKLMVKGNKWFTKSLYKNQTEP